MKYNDLELLKQDLRPGRIIQLSLTPEIPGRDELINHEIISIDFVDTKSGTLLLIELRNPDNNDVYKYAFPDITQIQKHDRENKYYLYCLNRSRLSEYAQKRRREEGYSIDQNIYEDAPTFKHRIIFI